MRGPVIPLALVLASPALWSAFVTGSMGVATALTRFLIAMVLAAIMLAILRSVTANYQKAARRRQLLDRLPPGIKERVRELD